MTHHQLHIEAALADPVARAEILNLIDRNVADWVWPTIYTRLASPQEWRKAVKG
jgi:hypothetical protein